MKPLHSLDDTLAAGGQRVLQFVNRHPRSITGAVVVMLGTFAATAFGIAPMMPDASNLPSRVVTQSVTPDGIDEQLEALAEHEMQLYRSDLTRDSDTADSLLRRLNVDDPQAAEFVRRDRTARLLLEGRASKMVQVRTNGAGQLEELVARYAAKEASQFNTHFTRLRVERSGEQFQATVEVAPLAAQVRLGSGTVTTSLFAATDEAHIPDTIASQMAEVFATDIDFRRELKRGDTFSVIYEALTADGEPITWNQASGRMLAAEFRNAGRPLSAVWFQDENGKGGYFDLDGQSKRRSFLASPMAFSRITSAFAMRLHPIQKTWRQHKGVDYGAPTGTPVRTVGDGVVEFAGRQGGYGNVVEVQHSHNRKTLYAHLSRIDVRKGQRVEQGAVIGAVGATGWATGPHLHFEFKVNDEQRDPMMIAKSSEAVTIAPAARQKFAALAQAVRAQLRAAETLASVSNRAE